MKTYYYSAVLLVCGAVYSFLSPNGSTPDGSRKTAPVSGQASSSADNAVESAGKAGDPSTYPENLCKQFFEPSNCESVDKNAEKWQLRDDITEPRFIVATVPDPVTTHLRVEFDRAIDGIKDAAADEHYLLTSALLVPRGPSRPPDFPISRASRRRTRNRALRRRLPGILLFENSEHHSLVVFLVGESPTNGIQRHGSLSKRCQTEILD